jgi:hypothetical protein
MRTAGDGVVGFRGVNPTVHVQDVHRQHLCGVEEHPRPIVGVEGVHVAKKVI